MSRIKFRSLLRLAFKNILADPMSLLLNIVLFALGIGLINFLILFNNQVKEKFESNLAGIDMVIGAKGSPLQMILCSMYHVDNPTGNISLKDAKPFLNPKHPLIKKAVPLSLGDSYKTYRIVGTTYDILDLYEAEVGQGRLWEHDQEVTIGTIVAEKTGVRLGDKFTSSHGFEEDEDLAHDHMAYEVVGILKPSGTVADQLVLTNTASVWNVHADHGDEAHDHDHDDHNHDDHNHDNHNHEGHNHEGHEAHDHEHEHDHDHGDDKEDHGGHEAKEEMGHVHDNSIEDLLNHLDQDITSILVQFKSKTNFQALSMPRNINENTELQAASPAYEINKLNANIGVGTRALRYLALLIAFVSGLSIFLSLFKSLQARKYELALMRVSGARPTQLLLLIILEGMILGVVGFIIGIALSHIAMATMAGFMSDAYQYDFTSWKFGKNELILLGLSLCIAFVASIIPAFKAFNTDINKTLSSK